MKIAETFKSAGPQGVIVVTLDDGRVFKGRFYTRYNTVPPSVVYPEWYLKLKKGIDPL